MGCRALGYRWSSLGLDAARRAGHGPALFSGDMAIADAACRDAAWGHVSANRVVLAVRTTVHRRLAPAYALGPNDMHTVCRHCFAATSAMACHAALSN